MTHRVTLIPGDGIGPEVTAAARRVIEAARVAIEWDVQEAGSVALARDGVALPAPVLESIRERRVALKGPLETSTERGPRSPNIALRDQLGLYYGVRPSRSPSRASDSGLDVVVIRMTSEDLYAGIEFEAGTDAGRELVALVARTHGVELAPDSGVSLKPLSPSAAERVAQAAFRYARLNGRTRVTAVHKASVMRCSDGLFLQGCRAAAGSFPEIAYDERLVDAVCHDLVTTPRRFDVLLCPVMYGDIVSDLTAGLAGGLGVAPGANYGDKYALFEAVHGCARRLTGRNLANPTATILSGALLLRHLGEVQTATRIEDAVAKVIAEGRAVTYDLRPDRSEETAAGTDEMTDAVIEALRF